LVKQELLKLARSLLRSELTRARRRRGRSPWVIGGLAIAIAVVSYFLHEPRAPQSALPKGAELTCTVKTIYDGDTLTARCPPGEVKVRMFGIDSPEMGQKPWGDASKQALQQLLAGREPVRLRVQDHDRYGRTVAQVFAGDRDVGLEMVRQGQAIMYEQYNDSPVYRQAQGEAKKARRGIWEQPGSQQDPAAWRRLNPR
jgi:endonuclease YncB( thermonuclease family)